MFCIYSAIFAFIVHPKKPQAHLSPPTMISPAPCGRTALRLIAAVLLGASFTSFLIILTVDYSAGLSSGAIPIRRSLDGDGDDAELAALLAKAASEDGELVVTAVNEAWASPGSLLDLFLASFRSGDGIEYLLNHLLVVALDPNAFDRCNAVHRFCFLLRRPAAGLSISGESSYLSRSYVELVWSKLELHSRILRLGYSFLFTDVDVLWLRNPMKHITLYADITISSDFYVGRDESLDNAPNTGLIYFRANNRTAAALETWLEARISRFPDAKQTQYVFNKIKRELVAGLGLRVRFVDTQYFGGFCSHGKDLNKMWTMHANCCVGLRKKMADLTAVAADWKSYMAVPEPERVKKPFLWNRTGHCLH